MQSELSALFIRFFNYLTSKFAYSDRGKEKQQHCYLLQQTV